MILILSQIQIDTLIHIDMMCHYGMSLPVRLLQEFSAYVGKKSPEKRWGKAKHLGTHRYSGQALPDSWDWVPNGAVTPVKDQGLCGSLAQISDIALDGLLWDILYSMIYIIWIYMTSPYLVIIAVHLQEYKKTLQNWRLLLGIFNDRGIRGCLVCVLQASRLFIWAAAGGLYQGQEWGCLWWRQPGPSLWVCWGCCHVHWKDLSLQGQVGTLRHLLLFRGHPQRWRDGVQGCSSRWCECTHGGSGATTDCHLSGCQLHRLQELQEWLGDLIIWYLWFIEYVELRHDNHQLPRTCETYQHVFYPTFMVPPGVSCLGLGQWHPSQVVSSRPIVELTWTMRSCWLAMVLWRAPHIGRWRTRGTPIGAWMAMFSSKEVSRAKEACVAFVRRPLTRWCLHLPALPPHHLHPHLERMCAAWLQMQLARLDRPVVLPAKSLMPNPAANAMVLSTIVDGMPPNPNALCSLPSLLSKIVWVKGSKQIKQARSHLGSLLFAKQLRLGKAQSQSGT